MDHHVKSSFHKFKYNFRWTLEEYSKIRHSEIISPYFYPEVGCGWYVTVSKTDLYLYFILHRKGGHGDVFAKCQLDVTGGKDILWVSKFFTIKFGNTLMNKPILDPVRIEKEDVRDEANDILEISLNLKLYKMNINLMDRSLHFCSLSEDEFLQEVFKSLSHDLLKLCEDKQATDLILSIENKTLEVHKAILSARSPVFAEMIQNETSDSPKSTIIIEDVKIETMKEVVHFMYGGVKRDYDYDTTVEMYHVASRYDMKRLRDLCSCLLASKLNMENARYILHLSNFYSDKWLTRRVMKYLTFYRLQEEDLTTIITA